MDTAEHRDISRQLFSPLPLVTLILIALLALPFSSNSASEGSASLDLFFFSIDRNPIEGLFYDGPNGVKTAVEFTSRRRAGPFPYEGPRQITFYHRVTDPDTSETTFEPATTTTVEQTNGEVLIFFLQNNNAINGQSRLRTIAMDDRPSSFPNGHLRVLNASGANLHGMIGNQRLTLDFEISEPYPFSSIMQRGQNWVEIAFVIRFPDAYELVYANQVSFSSTNRAIMVLRPPRRPNSIQINTYLIEDSTAQTSSTEAVE